MKVTGYQLKEALKIKAVIISALYNEHEDSIFKFEDEEKRSLDEILVDIEKHEKENAIIQTVQSEFNLSNEVEIPTLGKMSLEQAIKLVGGYGRMAKMYRSFAKGGTKDRWERDRTKTRNNNEETAKPVITRNKAIIHAKQLERVASDLRSAIAMANSKTFDTIVLTEDML